MSWAAFGAAAAQIGSQIGGKQHDYLLNKKLADRAHDKDVQKMKHKYQWQVEDLRAAGLNPMLAYSQTPQISSTPRQSSSGGAKLDVVAVNSAMKLKAETNYIEQQTKLLKEKEKSEPFNREKTISERSLNVHKVGLTRKQTALAQAAIAKTFQEIDLIKYQSWDKLSESQIRKFELNLLQNLENSLGEATSGTTVKTLTDIVKIVLSSLMKGK